MFDWKKAGQLGPEAPQDPFANMDPMVADYIKKKMGGVEPAQKQADMASMAGVATSAADSIANAMNQPVALHNRMQDLGKAPAMIEGRQQKTDISGLQRSAQDGLKMASAERDQALQMMLQQRKAELAAELQAKRDGEAAIWKQREFDQRERGMEAQAKSREAYANSMMGLKRDQLELQREKMQADGKEMPIEDKKVVEALATKNAGKISIANQMDSYLTEFKNAPDQATKLRIGGQMLKVLNSPEGADAIGVEEAKRLGDALEFQVFNVLGAGPMFGRDLPGFESQVKGTIDAVRGGIKTNQSEISRITGRGDQTSEQTKVINGATYRKVQGGWQKVK